MELQTARDSAAHPTLLDHTSARHPSTLQAGQMPTSINLFPGRMALPSDFFKISLCKDSGSLKADHGPDSLFLFSHFGLLSYIAIFLYTAKFVTAIYEFQKSTLIKKL